MAYATAVISGLSWQCASLEAVLREIDRSDADLTVNLGDSLFGPAAPLGTEGTGWSTEHKLIPYDWNAAADLAERNGRPGYATCDPQRKSAGIRPCAIGLPI